MVTPNFTPNMNNNRNRRSPNKKRKKKKPPLNSNKRQTGQETAHQNTRYEELNQTAESVPTITSFNTMTAAADQDHPTDGDPNRSMSLCSEDRSTETSGNEAASLQDFIVDKDTDISLEALNISAISSQSQKMSNSAPSRDPQDPSTLLAEAEQLIAAGTPNRELTAMTRFTQGPQDDAPGNGVEESKEVDPSLLEPPPGFPTRTTQHSS